MENNKKEVKHGKRNFGIFFLVLQLLAIIGLLNEGNELPNNILTWIGFCSFGIIGILLIISDKK